MENKIITINLLPWRAASRSENAKQKKFFLAAIIALLLLWILCHIGLNTAITIYDESISGLQSQLTDLMSQTDKNHINPSSAIIDQFHLNQMELIHFFKAIEERMQDTIILSEMTSKENNIVVTGYADSFLALSRFVDSYNNKNKLFPMTILSVSNDHELSAIQFRVKVVRPALPWIDSMKSGDDA